MQRSALQKSVFVKVLMLIVPCLSACVRNEGGDGGRSVVIVGPQPQEPPECFAFPISDSTKLGKKGCPDIRYKIGALPKHWDVERQDFTVAFQGKVATGALRATDRDNGNVIVVKSQCDKQSYDSSLVDLFESVPSGITQVTVYSQKPIELDDSKALRTRFQTENEAGRTTIQDQVIVKRHGCVFFLVHVARKEETLRARTADFESLLKGFHVELIAGN